MSTFFILFFTSHFSLQKRKNRKMQLFASNTLKTLAEVVAQLTIFSITFGQIISVWRKYSTARIRQGWKKNKFHQLFAGYFVLALFPRRLLALKSSISCGAPARGWGKRERNRESRGIIRTSRLHYRANDRISVIKSSARVRGWRGDRAKGGRSSLW